MNDTYTDSLDRHGSNREDLQQSGAGDLDDRRLGGDEPRHVSRCRPECPRVHLQHLLGPLLEQRHVSLLCFLCCPFVGTVVERERERAIWAIS